MGPHRRSPLGGEASVGGASCSYLLDPLQCVYWRISGHEMRCKCVPQTTSLRNFRHLPGVVRPESETEPVSVSVD